MSLKMHQNKSLVLQHSLTCPMSPDLSTLHLPRTLLNWSHRKAVVRRGVWGRVRWGAISLRRLNLLWGYHGSRVGGSGTVSVFAGVWTAAGHYCISLQGFVVLSPSRVRAQSNLATVLREVKS